MSDQTWYELEIKAAAADGSEAVKHLEYRGHSSSPEHAVHEIVEAVGEAVGSERLREVNTER